MRRALGVVALVLVLGAWGPCAPPINGGGGVATTDAEGWIYAGGGGDAPALDPQWENVGGLYPALAMRLRDEGTVDIIGVIKALTDAPNVPVVMTEGYRPNQYAPVSVTIQSGTDFKAGTGIVNAAGELIIVTTGIILTGDFVTVHGSYFLDTAAPPP